MKKGGGEEGCDYDLPRGGKAGGLREFLCADASGLLIYNVLEGKGRNKARRRSEERKKNHREKKEKREERGTLAR